LEHEETFEQRSQINLHVPPPPQFPIIPITKVRKDSYMEILNRRFVYFFLVLSLVKTTSNIFLEFEVVVIYLKH